MNDNIFLEPQKSYKQLSEINENEIQTFFNDLLEKSQINTEENKETVKQINAEQTKIDAQITFINKKRGLKGFLIGLCVVALIVSALFILYGVATSGMFLFYLIPGLVIALAIFFIIFIRKKFNPLIKNANVLLAKAKENKEKLIKTAYGQVQPLLDLFDWNMSNKIFTKTIPLIVLDDSFTMEQYQFLHDKYGFVEDKSKDTSTLFVQSGTILGNPFIIKRDLKQSWRNQIYTGSLVIHWTTVSYDSEGHSHVHHHTQTLHASVSKPVPDYNTRTTLVYGNEAAPNLSFSRTPQKLSFSNQRQEDRFLNKFSKKLDKLTQDAISKDKKFQRMSNTKFEAYFNALDRDNDLEFRLLFTPLAQKNMLSLLQSTEPFGDDFLFKKNKKLNSIRSDHSQFFDYSGDPNNYNSYSYEEIYLKFKEYNKKYFKYLFYDFCPLMSIPLYQQHKAAKYIYGDDYESNITSYETEVLANSYDPALFKNPESVTQVILKREFLEKDNGTDYDKIHAYSFKSEPRVDYVSVLGGDGEFHLVPVPWDEYLPVQKTTTFNVQNCNTTRQRFDNCYRNGLLDSFLSLCKNRNGIMYQRGIISLLGNKQKFDGKALNNLLDNKED